mmetsp:Transcript_20066/g.50769  ORF Transcript_20066/g.50769 Transcript_20066/m.50769 type:complete len:225 (-) Transcript_20066:35-709(-)
MSSSGMHQWEELRRRARQMESDIDTKLIQFNKLAVSPSSEDNGASALCTELESLLMQLSETNEHMVRFSQGLSPGEAARPGQVLQRHRELLHEYDREFRKIRSNITEQRERDELLGSVRADIGEYRTAASQRMESLVRERGSAQGSLRTTEQILAGAAATYDSLRSQRGLYGNISTKLAVFRSKLPSIDSLLGRIQRRRKVESMILAGVVSVCAIVVLYFSVLR